MRPNACIPDTSAFGRMHHHPVTRSRIAAAIIACLLLAGCASVPPDEKPLTAEEYRASEEWRSAELAGQLDSILREQQQDLREQERRLQSLERQTDRVLARLRQIDARQRVADGRETGSDDEPDDESDDESGDESDSESTDAALDQDVLPQDGPLIFGAHECVAFPEQGLVLRARIDSGANTSALNAWDIQEFERDGESWVRFRMGERRDDEEDQQQENGEEETGDNGEGGNEDEDSAATEILDNVMTLVDESLEDAESESAEEQAEGRDSEQGKDTDIEVEARIERRVVIRQAAGEERRLVVRLPVRIGPLNQQAEFTLTDRAEMDYPVLVGRRLYMDIALIDVGQEYVQRCPVDQ